MAFFKGVKDHTLLVGDNQVRCYESPPPYKNDETVVLFHGTGGSAENNFWALYPMFSMRFRVVAFDFVDADGEADAYHYARQAEAVIRHLGQGPVHIVGHSFGAVIAAQVAARNPDLTRSLTLIAGWIRTDHHQRLRNGIWRKLYDAKSTALADFMVLTAFSQSYLNARTPEEIQALSDALALGPDRAKKMEFNRAVDISADIELIEAPTLVVGCSYDQMVPVRHSRLLSGGISNCRFAEIPSGHSVTHERPSELFMLVSQFLSNPEDVPAGSFIQTANA